MRTQNMNNNNIPWIEKYRPKTFKELYSHEAITSVLETQIEQRQYASMIFYGPPGCGKSSCANIYIHYLFGPKYKNSDRLIQKINLSQELNAEHLQTRLSAFIRINHSISLKPYSTYLCPNFQVIILEECNLLTMETQWMIRQMMDQSVKYILWLFICNDIEKIIEPIRSRCQEYHFKPLNCEMIQEIIRKILGKENIHESRNDEVVNQWIILKAQGEMRIVLNLAYANYVLECDLINLEDIAFDTFNQLMAHIQGKKFKDAIAMVLNENITFKSLINAIIKHFVAHDKLQEFLSLLPSFMNQIYSEYYPYQLSKFARTCKLILLIHNCLFVY